MSEKNADADYSIGTVYRIRALCVLLKSNGFEQVKCKAGDIVIIVDLDVISRLKTRLYMLHPEHGLLRVGVDRVNSLFMKSFLDEVRN